MIEKEISARIASLEAVNTKLAGYTDRLEAVLEIMNLQSRFSLWQELGYYERIWEELFSHKNPGVKCEIGESGVYEGPESVKRLWMALAGQKRQRGYMANDFLMDPYIVIGSDNITAKGLWWIFGTHSDHATPSPGDLQRLTANWIAGKYDNEFVKEKGKWKLLSLHNIIYFRTPYDQGWFKEPNCARWQAPEGVLPDKTSTYSDLYHPDGICLWGPGAYPYEPLIKP